MAEKCGNPPAQLTTAGHQQGGGVLHFGFVLSDDDKGTKAIFFVIHPKSRKPYQHRFRTKGMLKLMQRGTSKAAGLGSSAAAGALIVIPGTDTVIGAAIANAAGSAASTLTPSFIGIFLRYIG